MSVVSQISPDDAQSILREREENLGRNQALAADAVKAGQGSGGPVVEAETTPDYRAQAQAELRGFCMLANGLYSAIGVDGVPKPAEDVWVESCTDFAAKQVERFGTVPHLDAFVCLAITVATFAPPTKAAYRKVRGLDKDTSAKALETTAENESAPSSAGKGA